MTPEQTAGGHATVASLGRRPAYVAQHDDGSIQTYTPAEFATKFGRKNDPAKARLLGPSPR
jgi:hypothetical protein